MNGILIRDYDRLNDRVTATDMTAVCSLLSIYYLQPSRSLSNASICSSAGLYGSHPASEAGREAIGKGHSRPPPLKYGVFTTNSITDDTAFRALWVIHHQKPINHRQLSPKYSGLSL